MKNMQAVVSAFGARNVYDKELPGSFNSALRAALRMTEF